MAIRRHTIIGPDEVVYSLQTGADDSGEAYYYFYRPIEIGTKYRPALMELFNTTSRSEASKLFVEHVLGYTDYPGKWSFPQCKTEEDASKLLGAFMLVDLDRMDEIDWEIPPEGLQNNVPKISPKRITLSKTDMLIFE